MLAIIPARGGSKGLPGKNIRDLNGKPLIAYTIEAAQKSKQITKIIISTDDEEIADVCREYIDIPFMRPQELAQDNSLIVDTYIYTVEKVNNMFGTNYDSVVALLPTCPLRTAEDIDKAIDIFKEKNADSVISFYEAPHPMQWYRKIDKDGVLRAVVPEGDRLANRQEEEKTYLPNGAIYVFKMDILRDRKYYSDKTYPYLMPAEKSIDIDNLSDFEYAEYVTRKGHE
ncbi:MAG: acylneuraminate cytidylyltransferase family protein [Helicobacteraceae bacterium]|nr:acylneuraminate cytidylyltransferase family protein [Helicobacteraceae bacterium]